MNNKEYEESEEDGGKAMNLALSLAMLLICAAFIGLILLLVGCSSTKYVPVETVRTEYREADTTAIFNNLKSLFESNKEKDSKSDSLVDRSREMVVVNVQGDTVRIEKTRYIYVSSKHEKELESKVKQQDSTINDLRMQLTSIKADSIPVPYPVEKNLTKWEQTKMNYGGIAITAWLALLCAAVVWLIRRFRK